MLQRGEPECMDGVRHRPQRLHKIVKRVPYSAFTRLPLSRVYDHLIAILVYQGSDPKVPYQALVIRESAMLFLGFAPWGRKAFSAREADAAEVYSPDFMDCTTPTPKRASTIGKMSPSSCGPRRRRSWIRSSSAAKGLASSA